jgi:hypothetical protein
MSRNACHAGSWYTDQGKKKKKRKEKELELENCIFTLKRRKFFFFYIHGIIFYLRTSLK